MVEATDSEGKGEEGATADGAAVRVLGPANRVARPYPRYSPWLMAPFLVLFTVGHFTEELVPGLLLVFAGLVGAVGVIASAGWLEDDLYRRMLRWNPLAGLAGAAIMPAAFLIVGLTAASLLETFLGPLGLGEALSLMVAVGGLWAASASVGSLLVRIVDGVVSVLVKDFRSRILAAVMGLVAFAASVVWLGLRLMAILVTKLERGEEMGDISIGGSGDDAVLIPTAEFFSGDPLGLTGALFFLGLLFTIPAALSVAGKLADSVMSRIQPLGAAFEAIGTGDRKVRIEEGGSIEMKRMASRFNRMVVDLELAERLERAFGVYVSPQVMSRIKERHGEARIPPELRAATVLFLDIRGFTSLSERLPPGTMAAVLNRYFERVVEVVDEHEGYLDKFIGDAVVVVWNGPVDQVDHPERAVRCAMALQEATAKMNEGGAFPECGALGVGIGVATGQVFCGNVGGVGQMEYTVIGDTVNLAARLTGQAPAGEVWVSPKTADGLPESIAGEPLEALQLKGKKDPIRPLRVWPRQGERSEGSIESSG